MDAARLSRALVPALAVLILTACPSGIDLPSEDSQDLPPNTNVSQGFEPGLTPTSPVTADGALCGGILPGAIGQPDVELVFYAFASAVNAGDGTGAGNPFVRETPPPTDGNGANDVFLAAVVRSSNPGSTVPNAFTQTLAPVMRHPRCVSCHSFHYPGGSGSGGTHTGGNSNGTNNGCANCHDASIGLSELGGLIDWRSPTPAQGDFDFRNKTTQQLYDATMAISTPDPVTHLKSDDRIFWGIELGLDPNGSNMGDVPITKAQWDVLVDAWAAGGFLFDTSGAVRDLTLVSVRAAAAASGDGASFHPHAVYVPEPAYDPNSTAPQVAGRVFVTFASDATDLLTGVGAASVARDVWRATIEVRMNEEPQAGLADPGKLNLKVRQDLLQRMSRSPVGAPGDDDSDHPRLTADGAQVAFDSLATNLVAGFLDLNGAGSPDVYLAQAGTNNTTLVSHANGFTNRGGNGASQNPSVSALAEAVVFETLADNIVPAGTLNGVRNVALAQPPGGLNSTSMVSVDTLGALATGGDCRNPSVFVDALGAAIVVFESDKQNLVDDVAPTLFTQLYARAGGVTQMLTRRKAKGGNGASTTPSLSADGRTVVFQSAATNLDTVRPQDRNGVVDVMRLDLEGLLATGTRTIERFSIAPDGSDGDGASFAPAVAAVASAPLAFSGSAVALFQTQATNTGKATNSDTILVFLGPFVP